MTSTSSPLQEPDLDISSKLGVRLLVKSLKLRHRWLMWGWGDPLAQPPFSWVGKRSMTYTNVTQLVGCSVAEPGPEPKYSDPEVIFFLQLLQLSLIWGVCRGRRLYWYCDWNVTSTGRLDYLVPLWLNVLLESQNITSRHCQWASSQRHDLLQECWCSWCLLQPSHSSLCLSL